mmetsp:Transcript_33934/g.83393  ORF Transcript_33934/g.83393 Transcript_33934/m.83393 type:complete len:212 (-) Transcript_33934:733-1368(-)|eukprot:CAMPEP_0206228652 /NCGR_PEP_ID=MMETSP0047_2-20121206/9282_1 /ASSEMBLY_ACC=CAM_ASM_000192 /TAXON_ID=195065 /ORGANISM="Chroomonas mesostigmatica_cf, Strain CCMP1168" /LENGTH=211 /DNA_ID=CAMNT_0053651907 /DNA_START=46 /DNA_END=681 /DNA_ORIENTATION=+
MLGRAVGLLALAVLLTAVPSALGGKPSKKPTKGPPEDLPNRAQVVCGSCHFVVRGNGLLTRKGKCDPASCTGTLVLGGKTVETIDDGVFDGLVNLETLDLKNNGFTDLPVGLFKDLRSISFLDLSDNHIKELPEGIFAGLYSLRTLCINNNKLFAVPPTIFSEKDLTGLKTLIMVDNELVCQPKEAPKVSWNLITNPGYDNLPVCGVSGSV